MASQIVHGHDIGRWVYERTGGVYTEQDSVSIGRIDDTGKLIGGVVFENYNGNSMLMHCAGEGAWINKDFLRKTFRYAFEQIKVHKLIGLVDSTNEKAIRLDLHLGFVQEAVITGAGAKGDLLVLTMTKEQCRYLSKGYDPK